MIPQCGTLHLNTVEWSSSMFLIPATGTIAPARPMAGSRETSSAEISSHPAATSSIAGMEDWTEPAAAAHASNSRAIIDRISYMVSWTDGNPAANSAAHMVSVSQIMECCSASIISEN